jgi:hypothetical protein
MGKAPGRCNDAWNRFPILKQGIPSTGLLVYGGAFYRFLSGFLMSRLLSILAFCLLILSAPVPAAAAEGVLNAVSYLALPQSLRVEVRTFDDSDDNLAIQQEFEKALRAKGVNISDDAPLVFNFEVSDQLGMLSRSGDRYVFSFETKGGRGGGENTEARVNVFNSQSGGLLNKGAGQGRVSKPSVYRMDVNIEDRASGKRLWEAWAEADLVAGNNRDLTRRMVPAIVERIGGTAKSEPFKIY